MAKRYSVVGVGSDGRTTTLLVDIGEAEARYIAKGMRRSECVRIDVVADTIQATNSRVDCAFESNSNAICKLDGTDNGVED